MANHRAEPGRRIDHRPPRDRLRRAFLPASCSSVIVASVVAAGGVAVVRPEAVASTMYDLSALVTDASPTNPTGVGIEDFYRGRFAEGRDQITVDIFTGPSGIYDAHDNHADDKDNVVMSSGWDAADVGLLLTYLDATRGDHPVATNARYVPDNNVARTDGGFGTRYPYDVNGDTPAYVLNVLTMANSLATYFGNPLDQDEVNLPVIDAGGQLDLDFDDQENSGKPTATQVVEQETSTEELPPPVEQLHTDSDTDTDAPESTAAGTRRSNHAGAVIRDTIDGWTKSTPRKANTRDGRSEDDATETSEPAADVDAGTDAASG